MKTIAIHLRLETASHRKRMMGIFRELGAASQYDIRIISNEDSLCDLLTAANGAERPDGIISGVPYSERAKNTIGTAGIPLVGIGMAENEIVSRPKLSGFVLNDNEGIGRAAAEFFLRLGGFRSFAYVPDTRGRSWSVLRGQAFAATLAAAGKDCVLFRSNDGDTASLSDFLSQLPRPAAVLAAWDGRAADVLHAAHKASLRIPEDISVLGVDDDEMICEHTVPPLSSVKTDAEGMGEASARMLHAFLCGRRKALEHIVRRPIIGITERRTTGSPAPATSLIERALAFIDIEATNGIKTDDVAKYLKVSRRLLDLRFKQFEAKSVTETIADRKIASVLRLLADTDLPVKDVFRQSGFSDVPYATKLFKKTTGATPETWREKRTQSGKGKVSADTNRDFRFERLTDIRPDDAKTLKTLVGSLDSEAAFDVSALRTAVRHGMTAVFVLRHRSRIVASATAVRFATPTGKHCRIEDVIVSERFRGKGLGRQIMSKTIEALERDGVSVIDLTSRPSRVAANALYRSLGFKRHRTNVYRLTSDR